MKEQKYMFKVAMVGDSGVGKRTLAKLATINVLDDNVLNDYGVVFTYYYVHASGETDVISAHFSIWDITGLLDVGSLRNRYERGASGLIAVADASRRSTVENIDSWISHVKDNPDDVDIVLVLNKIDLVAKDELDTIESVMKGYADKYDAELFQTSCVDKINVREPFLGISKKLCSKVIGEIGTITTIKPKVGAKKS
ncbi:MAG: GTP-binding protein [Methanomassiliicoccales archaeon]|nr:MAG: GTP-binding protein [Methanomassiliicoccales archaeon]